MADNNDDDSKVILKLREGEAYDGDGFWFCPSEVRDPPPTFRYARCCSLTLTPVGTSSYYLYVIYYLLFIL